MESLFLLIPVTLIFLGVAIWGFIWSVNHNQFDDLDSPANRILFDDDEKATLEAMKKEKDSERKHDH